MCSIWFGAEGLGRDGSWGDGRPARHQIVLGPVLPFEGFARGRLKATAEFGLACLRACAGQRALIGASQGRSMSRQ